jgi:hypothetical protein
MEHKHLDAAAMERLLTVDPGKCRGSARRFAAFAPSQAPGVTPIRIVVGSRADPALRLPPREAAAPAIGVHRPASPEPDGC